MMEFKIQKVKIDLEDMSAIEVNIIGRALLTFKEMDYINTNEAEVFAKLFEKMFDLEQRLIEMGEL